MNCESLYQQSKWKRQQHRQLQQEYSQQIKQMSSSKKINPHSHSILINRISEQLAPFPDQQILNIETSIPLLHSTQILQAIQSIQSAKVKLQHGDHEYPRLKEQARFVYCLWKMIDEEEIQTRQLKEIVYMLNMKQPADLAKALLENYSDQESVTQFVETWRGLLQQSQYYKSMEKMGKKKNALKEVQKLYENERRQGLKEVLLRNESTQIRDYFLDSKNINKSSKCLTLDTCQFSSKNKQNSYLDKSRQSQLVNRLYNNQRYKIREVQKKAEDQRRQKQQIQNCTFKPMLSNDRLRSASNQKRGSSINGYSKAVHRMKVGIEKTRMEKERRQYKPIGENYQKLREKKPNPPKFLQRKKPEQKIQFVIEFDLGRHKVKTKIHQNDNEQDVALNLCKIYCLKQDYFEQICMIIRKQRQIYESEQQTF